MLLYEKIGVVPFLTKTSGAPSNGFMDKCSDFIIIEKSFLPLHEKGDLYAYYLVKSGISTQRVRKIIIDSGYRGDFLYYGMKDSNSLSVQKVVLTNPWDKEECIKGKARLLYIGRTLFAPKKGGFNSNFFAIRFPVHINVSKTLEELRKLNIFPNFYGHQRFGVKHPLNHEMALEIIKNKELNVKSWKGRILAESMQSYIFNKCLSDMLAKNIFDGNMGILLGSGHEEALKKKNVSQTHYWCSVEIAEELGVLKSMSSKKFLKHQLRQLFIDNPLVRYYESGGKIIVNLTMPPGSYASLVIREVFKQNEAWIYKKCLPDNVCLQMKGK